MAGWLDTRHLIVHVSAIRDTPPRSIRPHGAIALAPLGIAVRFWGCWFRILYVHGVIILRVSEFKWRILTVAGHPVITHRLTNETR